MVATHGKGGTVLYAGGSVATIHNWSLDVATDMHDVTSFTTSSPQWRTFIDGLSGFTGTLTGTFDPTSTGQDNLITNMLTPTTGTVVLEKAQTVGGSFSGSVFLSNMSVNTAVDSPNALTFDMQGTGALTYSTAT